MHGPMLYFDLETTAPHGADARDPEQAVPVQIALGHYDPETDTAHPLDAYPMLVDPGFAISAESAEIHHITDAMVTGAPPVGGALDYTAAALAAAVDTGLPIAGMNLAYDFTVLDRRLRAHGLPTLGARSGTATPGATHDPRMIVLDACTIERWADQYRRGPRKLVDLCLRYGVALTEAHDADADAAASARLIAALADTARACADQHPHAPPRYTAPHITVPAHGPHRLELRMDITTPQRFAELATMAPADLQTGQAAWHAEFKRFVTKGAATPEDCAWPVRPLAQPARG